MTDFKIGQMIRVKYSPYWGIADGSTHIIESIDECDGLYVSGGLYLSPYLAEHVSTIVIGGKYTSHNGVTWECIGVKGDNAWMASDCGRGPSGAAYSFKTDGTNICQGGGGWNLKWEPVVEWVDTRGSWAKKGQSHPNHHQYNIRFPLIDGKPDFTQATVSPL